MTINLDDAAFDRGRADIREAAHRLRTARDRADRRVTGFVGAGWRGLAADAFVDAFDDWRLAARRVEDGLTTMAELKAATQHDLHARDTAVAEDLR
jgi:WXG100 family type VII secretion target